MKSYKFKPIDALARTVALWLAISIAWDAISLAIYAYDLHMLGRIYTLTDAEIAFWDLLSLSAFVAIGIYAVNVVMVCIWTYRASANAHSFKKRLETSPPWAVGWYFVPFASLFKPRGVVGEIWRASFPRTEGQRAPGEDILNGWWAFWIICGISGQVSFRLSLRATDPDRLVMGTWMGVLSTIASIGAAWMLRKIVLRISDWQAASRAAGVGQTAVDDADRADAPVL